MTETLAAAACAVLHVAEPAEKVTLSARFAEAWRRGALASGFDTRPPDRPARPARPS